jgi:DNA-binding protein HU-beta
MNKSDLVDALSARTGLTKVDSARAIEELFAPRGGVISAALDNGERVQITGFGTFECRNRQARTGRNPRTGETIMIAASRAPAFRPGKALKDAMR